MIHDLKPYPSYKDSSVPWLSEVPEHWKVVPNRSLFAEVKERNRSDEQLLSVTIAKGVILQSDLISDSSKKDSSNEDKSNYKFVRPGDIVYNKMRAWQGAVGVSKFQGIVSPAYIVVHSRNKQNSKYFHYLLRTPSFAKEAERWSYGITSDQWSLRPEHFKMIYCSLPPEDEQEAIVHYLDYMDRRIHRYIHAKQKLIKLLEEQKQAIIHRAVTRGLDPDVKFKDSGVEWLGDVPEHWEMRRNGRLFSQRNQTGYPDLPILEVSLKTGINIRDFDNGNRKQVMADREKYKRAVKGDIAYNMMRMWQGAVGVAPVDGLVSPAYVVASPLDRVNPEYYNYLFRTALYMREVDSCSRGIVKDRNRLYWEDFKQIQSPYPPIEEQTLIVDEINKDIFTVNQIIDSTNKEIDLLKEYRTRLISDVVTGKLDVREVAAELPVKEENAETFEDETEEVEENNDDELEEMAEEE